MAIGYTELDFVDGQAPALSAANLNHIDEGVKACADQLDAETTPGRALVEAATVAAQRTALDVDSKAEVTAKAQDPANVQAAAVASAEVTAAPAHWWVLAAGVLKRLTHAAWQTLVRAEVAPAIEAGTATATPADTDVLPSVSAAHSSQKSTWAQIKAAIWAAIGGVPTATQTANRIPLYNAAKGLNADGISFPTTQVPSADANTLDDYEEGTWTPTLIGDSTAGSPTYVVQVGTYSKIGRQVTLTFNVSISNKGGSSGLLAIGGIPFTNLSLTNYRCYGAIGYHSGMAYPSGYTNVIAVLTTGALRIYITFNGSNKTPQDATVSDVADSTVIRGSITYFSA